MQQPTLFRSLRSFGTVPLTALIALFLVISLLPPASTAEQTGPKSAVSGPISMSWSPPLERLPSPSPQALFVFQTEQSVYPTFNIVRSVDPIPHDLAGTVVSEYRSIGIPEPTVRRSVRESAFAEIELTYSAHGEQFTSVIRFIPLRIGTLICTFIDRSATIEVNRKTREELLATLAISPEETVASSEHPPQSATSRPITTIATALIVVVLAALMIGLIRRVVRRRTAIDSQG